MKIIFSLIISLQIGIGLLRGQESNIYPFDYSPRYQLKPYFAPMLTNLKRDNSISRANQIGFSGGVDFIFYMVNTGRLKPSLSIGLNISSYNSTFNLNYNDSLWTIDPGNDRVHVYEQGNISEQQQVIFVSVPLQFHLDFSFSKHLGAYISAGYYYSFISSGTYASDVLLSRQGYYPRYNVLLYDIDVEGSQYFYPSNKSMSEKEALLLNNSQGYVASAGIRYRLSSVYSMFIGLKNFTGRNNISGYDPDDGFLIVSNQRTLNSTMAMDENVTTGAWGVEFGLNINLGKNKTRNIFQILQRIRQNVQKH